MSELRFLFTFPPLQCYRRNHHQYPNLAVLLSPHALCLGTPLGGECSDTTTAGGSGVLDWMEVLLNGP